MPKGERRAELLNAAIQLAETVGADKVTHAAVAAAVGVTHQLVVHYFGTVVALRRDIMRAAVKQRLVPIVARGIALRDSHALRADEGLRAECAAYLMRG